MRGALPHTHILGTLFGTKALEQRHMSDSLLDMAHTHVCCALFDMPDGIAHAEILSTEGHKHRMIEEECTKI